MYMKRKEEIDVLHYIERLLLSLFVLPFQKMQPQKPGWRDSLEKPQESLHSGCAGPACGISTEDVVCAGFFRHFVLERLAEL